MTHKRELRYFVVVQRHVVPVHCKGKEEGEEDDREWKEEIVVLVRHPNNAILHVGTLVVRGSINGMAQRLNNEKLALTPM